MNYEILSIETAELTAKGIRKQKKIEEVLKYLNNIIKEQDIFNKEDLLLILVKVSFMLKEIWSDEWRV